MSCVLHTGTPIYQGCHVLINQAFLFVQGKKRKHTMTVLGRVTGSKAIGSDRTQVTNPNAVPSLVFLREGHPKPTPSVDRTPHWVWVWGAPLSRICFELSRKKERFCKKTYLWSENGTWGLIDRLQAEFINCTEVEMKIQQGYNYPNPKPDPANSHPDSIHVRH